MKKTLFIILFLAIFYTIILAIFRIYLAIPIVYWSVSENKCKMVEINGVISDKCILPAKYELVYVK